MNRSAGVSALAILLLLNAGDFAYGEKAAPVSRDDSYDLSLQVGRLGVMLDQMDELGEAMAGSDMPKNGEAAQPASQTALLDLREAVLRYDLYVTGACSMGVSENSLCRPLYLPTWLNDPPNTAYSGEQLRTMAEESATKITVLWRTVCAKGQRTIGDGTFCALE